jgi:hypothetical protein
MELGPFNFGQWSITIPLGTGFGLILVAVLWYLIFLYPVIRIIRRAGYSGWNVLWIFVPVANIIALWLFAFGSWPAIPNAKSSN